MTSIYEELEKEVISDIARRVNKCKRYTETAEIMADSMRDQGFNTGRIQAEVRKLLNKDAAFQAEVAKNTLEYKEEVRKIIAETEAEALKAGDLLTADAGDMSFRYDLEAWNQPGADVTKPSNLSQIISAIQKQTRGELKNITQSMAFKNTPFETTGIYNAYRREMDLAIMKIGTGTWSWDQAARDCVHRLAKSGLRSIDYTKDGKTRAYQLDTSVRMCLRTGMNQLAGKIQEENMKQFDTPLVYVDAHAGSRPEHAVWQGKVYAYNPNGRLDDGRKAGEVYGDFFSETDYGSVTGLMGVNCSHHFYPYHEGDAIPEFKEPEPVEIDGKTYTYYEATQEMRKQEREIRAQKREIEATQALGQDTTTLAAQLKGMQANYRSFSASAGINPRNSALRVEYGTSNLSKTKAKTQLDNINIKEKTAQSVTARAKASGSFKTRAEEREAIKEAINLERPIFADNLAAAYMPSMKKAGMYDLVGHGAPKSMEYFGKEISVDFVYKVLMGREDYKPGTPVRLMSCLTGVEDENGECFAQSLSNMLNVTVEAPKGLLNLHSNGIISVEVDDGETVEIIEVRDKLSYARAFGVFNPIYR